MVLSSDLTERSICYVTSCVIFLGQNGHVGKTRFELDDDEDEDKVEDEDETGEGDSEDERNESGLGNDDQCRLNRLFQKNGVFQKKCTSVVRSQSHLSFRTRVSKQGGPGGQKKKKAPPPKKGPKRPRFCCISMAGRPPHARSTNYRSFSVSAPLEAS